MLQTWEDYIIIIIHMAEPSRIKKCHYLSKVIHRSAFILINITALDYYEVAVENSLKYKFIISLSKLILVFGKEWSF